MVAMRKLFAFVFLRYSWFSYLVLVIAFGLSLCLGPRWLRLCTCVAAMCLLPFAMSPAKLNDEAKKENALDVFKEAIIAAATSFVLLGVEELQKLAGDTPANPGFALGLENLVKAATVFIVVFVVQQINKVYGRLQDHESKLQTHTADLKEATGSLAVHAEQVREADYAGMAARLLSLPDIADLRGDKQARESITGATKIIEAWTTQAKRAGAADDISRKAWWSLMRSYHREELFDISQQESATNVRNYAMILLALIGTALPDPKTRPGARLVVLNVSTFPPKDFYNFPNGLPGRRFYHEPEFFGTYRRMLSFLAADNRVATHRIVLSGPNLTSLPIPKPEQYSGLDAPLKAGLDACYCRVCPLPVTKTKEDVSPEVDLPVWSKVLNDLAYLLDRRLPDRVGRVLYQPFIKYYPPDVKQDSRNANYFEAVHRASIPGGSYYIEFAQRRTVAATAGTPADTKPTAISQAEFGKLAASLIPGDAAQAFAEAWVRLCEKVVRFGRKGAAIKSDTDFENKELLWKTAAHLTADILADQKNWRTEFRTARQELQQPFGELVDRVAGLAKRIGEINKQRALGLTWLPDISTQTFNLVDSLLETAKLSQEADSLDKYIELLCEGNEPNGAGAITAGNGLHLGFAEKCLHRLLILLEGKQKESLFPEGSFVPVWKLMATDLLGLDPATGLSKDAVLRRVESAIRFVPLEDVGGDDSVAARDMAKCGIADEFLLIGVTTDQTAPASGPLDPQMLVDRKRISWEALVATNIAEPFHTCRVKVLFRREKGGHDQDVLDHHVDWALTQWQKQSPANADSATSVFKKALEDYI